MNERIYELAVQAKIQMVSEPRLQEFAGLIMEEMYCFMVDSTQNDQPWPSFEQIKQHFGVEE